MRLSFLFLILIGGAHFSVRAAYQSAVSTATANSRTAGVDSAESPFGNPAALPFLRGYIFTTGANSVQNSLKQSAQQLAFSITDNLKETIVPTSFAFVQTKGSAQLGDSLNERDFRLSFGNFLTRRGALGLTLRYLDTDFQSRRETQTHLNFGGLYSFTDSFGAGFLVERAVDIDSPDAASPVQVASRISLGTSYIHKKFMRAKFDLESDSRNSFDRPTWSLGLEHYLNAWLVFRLGHQRITEFDQQSWGGGLGFVGPKFGLHYGYLQNSSRIVGSKHSIDLALPLW